MKSQDRGLSHGSLALTRRLFLGAAAGTSAALADGEESAQTAPPSSDSRARRAYRIRVDAARMRRDAIQPEHSTNGDEQQFANKIGNFSKGLPHNTLGEVDLNAYQVFTQALMDGGSQSDIEKVPMGSADPALQRKFENPCAGVCFELAGADSHHLSISAAPSVQSAETAGEMVELYWKALARDVPFTQYDSDPVTQAAAAELSKLSDFRGPKANNAVTTAPYFGG